MTKQVFISYSSQDRAVAESIHDALERAGLPAWLAHRDLTAGVPWSQRIVDEIHASRVMILLLSKHANESPYVIREVGEAVARRASIVTVRLEDVAPTPGLKFFIDAEQWFDAVGMPPSRYQKRLIDEVRLLIGATGETEVSAPPVVSHETRTPAHDSSVGLAALLRDQRTLRGAAIMVGVVALGALAFRTLPIFQSDPPQLVIGNTPDTLFVGDTLRLITNLAGGNIFYSSSNPQVMSSAAESNVFHAVGAGTAVLIAQLDGASDSVTVTVSRPAIGSVTIAPPPAIRVGDTHQLTITATDRAGRAVADAQAAWSSETPRIVSVDSNGVARGVAAGQGKILARLDSVSATAAIVVNPRTGPADGIRIPPLRDVPVARDPAPTNPTVSNTPSEAMLDRLAKLCADNIASKNITWISNNYHPSTPSDQTNLQRLRTVMGLNNYRMTQRGTNIMRPELNAVDFSVEINYTRSFGGTAGVRGTFRVLATSQSGSWRLASCRVEGVLLGT